MDIPFCQQWILSNGFAGQCKNACVVQWLSLFHIKYNVSHLWRYFEIGDGKGEHDGASARIKTTL